MARAMLSLAVWALLVLHVVFAIAADEQKAKLVSSVSVEGLVFCDRCLQEKVTKSSSLLKGAKVAVVCESRSAEAAIPVEVVVVTDAKGRFKAEVPKSAFDSEGQISCAAELRESPLQSCKLLGNSRQTSPTFRRQAAGAGAVVYAAGDFSFRPQSAGLLCAQESYYYPMYKPPTYKPPVYQTPQYKPPVYQTPQYKPPVYQTPQYKPPVYQTPQYKPPVYQTPQYKPPSYKPPYIPKFKIPKFKIPKFKIPKYKYPPQKP